MIGLVANLPRGTPFFSFSILIRSNSVIRAHSSAKSLQACSCSVPLTSGSHRGCSGDRVTKVTPKIVSGRVVNAPMLADAPSTSPTTGNSMWAPCERPIQFRCIALTFSGNSIWSNSSNNSSAYSVIRKNHCAISF